MLIVRFVTFMRRLYNRINPRIHVPYPGEVSAAPSSKPHLVWKFAGGRVEFFMQAKSGRKYRGWRRLALIAYVVRLDNFDNLVTARLQKSSGNTMLARHSGRLLGRTVIVRMVLDHSAHSGEVRHAVYQLAHNVGHIGLLRDVLFVGPASDRSDIEDAVMINTVPPHTNDEPVDLSSRRPA